MAAKRRYFVEKDSDYYWVANQDGVFLRRFDRRTENLVYSYPVGALENLPTIKKYLKPSLF